MPIGQAGGKLRVFPQENSGTSLACVSPRKLWHPTRAPHSRTALLAVVGVDVAITAVVRQGAPARAAGGGAVDDRVLGKTIVAFLGALEDTVAAEGDRQATAIAWGVAWLCRWV